MTSPLISHHVARRLAACWKFEIHGLLAVATFASVSGAELRVSMQDEHGTPLAAAVGLYDSSNNLRLPAQALDLAGMGFHYTAGDLIHYADWKSTRVRSQDPCFGSSYFRAQHPAGTTCFFVKGRFSVAVEPGTYRLVVSKGLEYTPFETQLTVGGNDCDVSVTLRRWVDMAARGWYSGDDHVHIERATPDANRDAFLWAEAEDVRVCNVLLMGDARKTYYGQYAFGAAGRASAHAAWLVPGQEDPRTSQLGHTLHLNMREPLRAPSRYYAYESVFAGNRGRGLSGLAHVGRRRWHFHADRGLSLLAPRGLVDFVEVAQMGYIGVNRWYEFLNLGFRLTATAGNDVPWGGSIGTTRMYAYTGDRFDADAWFDAVRRGRTFVTTGPMLEFTVNGALPGTVLPARQGETVVVKARAWGGQPGRTPVRLKLVSFGKVLKEISGNGALEVALTLRAEESFWITAECETNTAPLMDEPGYFAGAVATPVYVQVDGRPTQHAQQLPALVRRRLQTCDEIEQWLATGADKMESGADGGWESPEAFRNSIPEIRRQVDAARAYFSAMLTESPKN